MRSQQQHFEAVLATLGSAVRGSFFRAVPLQFQATPLSAIGSVTSGGRYNPREGFEVLYLGENPDTVIREIRFMVRDPAGQEIAIRKQPQIMMTIEYDLQHVANLTDPTVLRRLHVTRKSLLGEWADIVDAGNVPVTHTLGRAALAVGLEGLIVPSARHRGASNLAVIPQNLRAGSFVQIYDPQGFNAPVTIRIDGSK
jgi:RES domain-containing protein